MNVTMWSKLLDRCFPPSTCQKEDAVRRLRQCIAIWGLSLLGHYSGHDSDYTNSVKRYKLVALDQARG